MQCFTYQHAHPLSAAVGTIAGVGPVYQLDGTDETRLVAMLDPSFMLAGQNALDVYLVDRNGTTLRPLSEQR